MHRHQPWFAQHKPTAHCCRLGGCLFFFPFPFTFLSLLATPVFFSLFLVFCEPRPLILHRIPTNTPFSPRTLAASHITPSTTCLCPTMQIRPSCSRDLCLANRLATFSSQTGNSTFPERQCRCRPPAILPYHVTRQQTRLVYVQTLPLVSSVPCCTSRFIPVHLRQAAFNSSPSLQRLQPLSKLTKPTVSTPGARNTLTAR